MPKPHHKNRNKVKQFFITFPQSGKVEKKEFLDNLPPLDYGFIVCEKHKDGNPHLHASVVLKHKINTKAFIDWVEVKYPNDWKRIQIEPTRSIQNVDTYLSKEDPCPLVVGCLEKNSKLKLTKIEDEIKRLDESKTFDSFFMSNRFLSEDDLKVIHDTEEKSRLWPTFKKEFKKFCVDTGQNFNIEKNERCSYVSSVFEDWMAEQSNKHESKYPYGYDSGT
jgi:hypothetical protein